MQVKLFAQNSTESTIQEPILSNILLSFQIASNECEVGNKRDKSFEAEGRIEGTGSAAIVDQRTLIKHLLDNKLTKQRSLISDLVRPPVLVQTYREPSSASFPPNSLCEHSPRPVLRSSTLYLSLRSSLTRSRLLALVLLSELDPPSTRARSSRNETVQVVRPEREITRSREGQNILRGLLGPSL